MATAYGNDTRKINPEPNKIRFGGNSDPELNIQFGCGEIPLEGRFNQRIWANRFLGIDEKTFRRYVEKFRVPHKRCGGDLFVDARDFWDILPSVTFNEE